MSSDYQQLKDIYAHERERCDDARDRLNSARKKLYIASLATVAVYLTNAIPTRIEPLGIDFSALEARNILPLASIISAYFLALYCARELQFQAALVTSKLTGKQLNKSLGMLDQTEYRKQQGFVDRSLLLLGDVGRRLVAVLLTTVPLAVGVLAILVGLMPSEFAWLKGGFLGTSIQ